MSASTIILPSALVMAYTFCMIISFLKGTSDMGNLVLLSHCCALRIFCSSDTTICSLFNIHVLLSRLMDVFLSFFYACNSMGVAIPDMKRASKKAAQVAIIRNIKNLLLNPELESCEKTIPAMIETIVPMPARISRSINNL